jgi:lipopolysaccharide/colanic/teichoic acid biosynthesis glycosyltransferase
MWGRRLTDLVDGPTDAFGIKTASETRAAWPTNLTTLQSGIPLYLENGFPTKPISSRSRTLHLRLKRALDVGLSLGAILALAPLLLSVALAIKLTSPGPILYRQRRPGLNGVPFQLLKFRSMSIEHCDDGSKQATIADSRVTMVGRFIRKTSIDELPQLWNILIGEMSLVGPRPMVEGQLAAGRDYRDTVPYYDFRLNMKPGLTGWAQANGLRGPTSDEISAIRRIDHDCAYIQNFSIFLDARAIFKTIVSEFLNGSGL